MNKGDESVENKSKFLIILNMKESEEIIKALLKFRNERDWAQFHDTKNLAVALSIEAAELNELFLWKNLNECETVDKEMLKEELADIFASNFGGHIHDPFALSVLKYGSITPDEIEIDDFAEEEIETLVDVDPEEKLTDDDFIDCNCWTCRACMYVQDYAQMIGDFIYRSVFLTVVHATGSRQTGHTDSRRTE